MFRFLHSVLILIIPLTGCTQKNKATTSKRTVISGRIGNVDPEHLTLTFNYWNPFGIEDREVFILEGDDLDFSIETNYAFAQYVNFRYGNRFFYAFIEPGDSLFEKIDGKKSMTGNYDEAVKFSGDRADESRQLMLWMAHRSNIPDPEIACEGAPEEYAESFSTYRKVIADSVDAFSSKVPSARIKKMVVNDEMYSIANYLEYMGDGNLWEAYPAPVFDIFNSENFHSGMFGCHLGKPCSGSIFNGIAELSENPREDILFL